MWRVSGIMNTCTYGWVITPVTWLRSKRLGATCSWNVGLPASLQEPAPPSMERERMSVSIPECWVGVDGVAYIQPGARNQCHRYGCVLPTHHTTVIIPWVCFLCPSVLSQDPSLPDSAILSASPALTTKSSYLPACKRPSLSFKSPQLKDQTKSIPSTDSPLTPSRPLFCVLPVSQGTSLDHFLTQNRQRQTSLVSLFLE